MSLCQPSNAQLSVTSATASYAPLTVTTTSRGIALVRFSAKMSQPSSPSDADYKVLPQQGWSYRVPLPPQICIPPPTCNRIGIPDLRIGQDPSNFDRTGFRNIEFLKTVSTDNIIRDNNYKDWKYEQRRAAQQVLPFLWLGPVSAARDSSFLQSHQITMILAMRNIQSGGAISLRSKAAVQLGIESRAIDVAGTYEVIPALLSGIEIINTHVSDLHKKRQVETSFPSNTSVSPPGKVLVYCESGNELSSIFLAAYLMAIYSIDLVKAIQVIQAQRFCAPFDDASKFLLQTFGDIVQAQRDSLLATTGASHKGTSEERAHSMAIKANGSKRNLDKMYNEEGDGELDIEWDQTRKGYAPFQG